jgi:hypothetical protein
LLASVPYSFQRPWLSQQQSKRLRPLRVAEIDLPQCRLTSVMM